jgi:hypothetical protein
MRNVIVRGAGGGGDKKPRAPIESPDSLRSIAYARILDMVSEGEIVGFANPANPLSCMFLNETPIANADGTLNFKNVQVDSRTGTQTQDYIKGFDSVESEVAVGVELRADTPWTHTITNMSLSAFRLRLSVPALSKANTTNGDITGYRVDYKIEISVDGGSYNTLLEAAFIGKTSSKYERSHRIDLPDATTSWTIRVSRLTANSTSSALQDTTVIESFADIIDVKLRMPMTAAVSLVIDAQQFNAIPSRAFRLKGRIIRVPTNYNPTTRVYTGVWDGTFQTQYSNNPAWVFYDMATNPRYGLGHLISSDLIDKWALYKIAMYCDELVDDGFGGLEPRFVSNLYLQSQNDALRVMQDMATMFRGILYAAAGSVTAVADMPEDPVYTYTPANVIDGKFVYAGSSRKVRHTVALVSWSDMTDFGRAKVEYIEDEDGIARYGVQQTEVIAIGCTSRGQARRLGKYILTTERYETDTVAFGVGLDGTFPAPGKIINIADPLRAGRRTGGRVRSATINSITVDSLPVVSIGHDLTVILPTGVAEKRPVSGIAGNVISVSPNFSQVPVGQSVWLVESEDLAAQTFRVLGVSESTDYVGYTVNAIQHVPGKFDFVENNIQIVEPPISSGGTMPAPEITLTSFLRFGHGDAFTVINADWPDLAGAVSYAIQWQKDNGPWSDARTIHSSNDEWEGAFAGKYTARVWGINSFGIPGQSGVSDPITVDDAQLPIIDLGIDSGVVVIDCRYMQFRLVLTEDVSEVRFINAAPQDTLLIELTQGPDGGHTINFGASVVPISGLPYVATPTANAVDVLGLTTNNSGVTWRMTAQQPVGSGGTPDDNAFVVILAPSPASESIAYSGTPVAPVAHIVASPYNGTAPYTYEWSRADTGSIDFLIDDPTASTVNFTIPVGSTTYNFTQQWRCVVTDSTDAVTQQTLYITLARTVAAPAVGVDTKTIWSNAVNPISPSPVSTAMYQLQGDGNISGLYNYTSGGSTLLAAGVHIGYWTADNSASNYQVRATLVSGPALASGFSPVGTWLNLPSGSGNHASWGQQVSTSNASRVSVILVEIRNKTTGTVLDSAYVTLKATTGQADGLAGIS